MNIFRVARYFALGLLLIPLGLVLLWAVITFLPGLAEFLHATIWALLGQIPIFSQASELLQSMVNMSQFAMDEYLIRFPVLLFSALGDSLIIGCCIFCVKAIFTRFNRRWQGRFTKPVWLMVLMGVVAGVSICAVKDQLAANAEAIVTLVVCLVCYLSGLGLMLRGLNFTRGGTYHNRWAGFLIRMLLGILSDMFDALCGVFIATALLQGARFVRAGGNGLVCVWWIVVSALLMFAKNALLDAMEPRDA